MKKQTTTNTRGKRECEWRVDLINATEDKLLLAKVVVAGMLGVRGKRILAWDEWKGGFGHRGFYDKCVNENLRAAQAALGEMHITAVVKYCDHGRRGAQHACSRRVVKHGSNTKNNTHRQ